MNPLLRTLPLFVVLALAGCGEAVAGASVDESATITTGGEVAEPSAGAVVVNSAPADQPVPQPTESGAVVVNAAPGDQVAPDAPRDPNRGAVEVNAR